jgi:hypothetical protein
MAAQLHGLARAENTDDFRKEHRKCGLWYEQIRRGENAHRPGRSRRGDEWILPMTRSASLARYLLIMGAALLWLPFLARAAAQDWKPPPTLRETGLYSHWAELEVDANHIAFSPQYPLWTDGAKKRRWLSLPPGTAVDASDPDNWVFPVGTRIWKEFAFDDRRVETRYMELLPEGWLYAAYAWNSEGSEAELVSERGRRSAYRLGRGRSHTIPSVNDCKACHRGGGSEVLGFSTLQLSPARDPGALHIDAPTARSTDLASLVANGFLTGLPSSILQRAPRIAARTATERAALGYLHGNCGHCHNDQGSLRNIELFLRHRSDAPDPPGLASTIGHPIRKAAPSQSPDARLRVVPGDPGRSALLERVGSRYPALQMPPLGTVLVDEQAVSLLRLWVAEIEKEGGEYGTNHQRRP